MVSTTVPITGYAATFSPERNNSQAKLAEEPLVDLVTLQHTHIPGKSEKESSSERNILRDTLLRYLGYANEFTEAGKTSGIAIAKVLNPFAWITVFSYGIADALNRSLDKQRMILKTSGNQDEAKAKSISAFTRDILFHLTATWYGPVYFVIKPVAKLTEKVMRDKLKKDPRFWPSIAGLITIPFVPKLFDPITEKLLEATYDPLANRAVNKYLNRPEKQAHSTA